MPWKVYQEKGQYCVHKLNSDGSKGATVPGGCHKSKADAIKHQKALYRNVQGGNVRLKIKRKPGSPIAAPELTTASPLLVTIPDVEIVSVGEYDLASGKTTFTEDDLAAAVAAQDDPAIQQPRLKIGHTSKFGDSEPSFGTITNMRLADNNQKIVGDFTGVPEWLAKIMPTAYPSRSIEGGFDVDTPSGNKHGMVITAVALLGVVAPGVADLEDLVQLYGAEVPDDVEISAKAVVTAKAHDGSIDVSAAVNVEDVRRAFYDSLDQSQAYWWIRSMQLDPSQLIVDDDDGHLFQVSFSITADGVEFGDPEEVRIEYVPINASSERGRVTVRYASRSESRPKSTDKEDSMDPKAIRESLGLAEDATDEEVLAAASNLRAESSDGEDDDDDESSTSGTEAEGESTEDDESEEDESEEDDDEGTVAKGGNGTVRVDSEEWKRLQAAAQQGAQARQEQIKAESERMLSNAVKEGRIPPSRKEHYRKLLASDPEGTKTLLTAKTEEGGLAPGTIPVDETGGAGSDDQVAASSYDESWLTPAERARAEGKTSGPGVITTER